MGGIAQHSFTDSLRSGEFGLKWVVPDVFQVIKAFPWGVDFRDDIRQVTWRVGFSPAMLDLRREHDSVLRQDTQTFLRGRFKGETARTADPAWSPLIDLEYVDLQGGTGLLVVYRSAYEPGNEILVGELNVPIRQGMLYFSAWSWVGITGLREAVLVDRALSQGRDFSEITSITQEQFDDPRHDVDFPGHSLTIVRAAMKWLVEDTSLVVTNPMIDPNQGETRLPEAGCAVVLPPRYVLSRIFGQAMTKGLVTATRTCPPISSAITLEIFRSSRKRLTGWRKQARLKRLAVRATRAWRNEGITDINIEADGLPELHGRTQIEVYVRFKSPDEERSHAIMRWFIDADGEVFLVRVGAPLFVKKAQLLADVESVVQSWRHLDVT
jgi:hypothetical protein